MSTAKSNKNNGYFNISLDCVGYVNDVKGHKGYNGTFVSVNIAALQGKKDAVKFARFNCIAVTDSAIDVLRTIKTDHPSAKIFAKFKLSGLETEPFTYPQTSKRVGETGVNIRSKFDGRQNPDCGRRASRYHGRQRRGR